MSRGVNVFSELYEEYKAAIDAFFLSPTHARRVKLNRKILDLAGAIEVEATAVRYDHSQYSEQAANAMEETAMNMRMVAEYFLTAPLDMLKENFGNGKVELKKQPNKKSYLQSIFDFFSTIRRNS